jgi:hypothetical protein
LKSIANNFTNGFSIRMPPILIKKKGHNSVNCCAP